MLLAKLSPEALGKVLTMMAPHLAQSILLVRDPCITQYLTGALQHWLHLFGGRSSSVPLW